MPEHRVIIEWRQLLPSAIKQQTLLQSLSLVKKISEEQQQKKSLNCNTSINRWLLETQTLVREELILSDLPDFSFLFLQATALLY